jgi:predicted phage tail protein
MTTELTAVSERLTPVGFIKFLDIKNPFEPHNHEDSLIEWRDGMTVAAALSGRLDPDSSIICLNGGVVSADSWDSTIIPEGSCLALSQLPEGGGSGKDILRLVLTVAIIATGQWYLGTTLTAGSASFYAASAALVVGTTLLVNALVPPTLASNDDMSDSPTYGIDGAKNTSREGVKVPVCYGAFRMAGNIISMHVRNTGDTQYLYMLLNAGEGPVAAITDIQVNDQPIANFQAVETDIRLGSKTQEPIEWFEANTASVSRGVTIGTGWSTYTGLNVIDRFRLDFVSPTGIWRVDDKGRRKTVTVTLEAQYRKVGTSDWTTLVPGTEPAGYSNNYVYYGFNNYNPSGDILGSNPEIVSPALTPGDTVVDGVIYRSGEPVGYLQRDGQYGGSLSITLDKTSPYRWSVYSPTLSEGAYEVRVRRTNAETETDKQRDKVVWSDYTEIVNDKVAYRNTALVGLKIKLTDQLSSLPNVTYLNQGRVIKYWTGTGWKDGPSNNPAWVVFDMLTNTRYGAAIEANRIDIERWKEWGDYCDSAGLTFDGVLDASQSLWDAMQYVFRAGHARMLRIGTKYAVAIEQPTAPTMMFAVGNIIKGSFNQSWSGIENRANEVEVNYFDKEDNYKQHTIKVYDSTASPNAKQTTANFTLYGITDAQRATKEGIFQLKLNKYVQSTCSFEAPIEAIACTVGDTILVQHDQPAWSYGGRLESGSTTTSIKLDRPVTLVAGPTYKLLVHFSALARLTGTVSAVSGNVVTLSGYAGQTNIHRLIVAGVDYQVSGFHAGGVLLDTTPSFSAGVSYTAYETDAIETRDVTTGAGTHSIVTVSPGFPVVPAEFSNFMLGENAQVTKAWRINAIDMGSSDMTRKIDCFEYAPEVYDWTGSYTQPDGSYSLVVPHVTNVALTELTVPTGTAITTELQASWSPPVDYADYDGVDIYRSVDAQPYEFLTTVRAPLSSYTFSGEAGQTIVLRVVTRTRDGRFAPQSSAPTTTRVISGDTVAPAVPTAVTLEVGQIGLDIGFARPLDLDYIGAEVWRNTVNNSATASLVFTTDSTQSVFSDLGADNPALSYYYWVRSVDASNNKSAFVATIPAFASPTGILVTALLTNESVSLSATNDGTVTSFATATGAFKVYEGSIDVTSLATFSEVAESNCSGTINSSGVYSVTSMSATTASYTMQAVYKGVTIQKVFTLSKSIAGIVGSNGNNVAQVLAYKRTTVAPTDNPGAVTFEFASGTITTGTLANGWSKTIPSGTNPLYVIAASAVSTAATDTIAANEWGSPALLVQDGSPGINTATVYLFQRTTTTTAPALPSANVTYTFSSGAASGVNNGWSQTMPTTGGAYRWMTTATALGTSATDTIASSEWAAASLIAQDGANGTNGTNGSNGSNGVNAIDATLSKTAVTVFAYADGSVPSFAGIDGQLTVYSGATDVTASATLSATASGLTGTINTAANTPVSGQPKGYYRVTAMSGETGTLTFSVVYGGVTYTRVFSVSKVKTGYEIVSSLPSTNLFVGRMVFLTTDNKLYRYTGSAWTTAVPAVDISGTVSDAQIAGLAAAKITGQLSNTQIADLAATKITGQLSNAQIADLAATKISGTLSDAQLAAISAAKITGQLSDSQLQAISAAKIAGQLTSSQIASIEAAKIAGQLSDSQIASVSLTKINGQVGGGNLLNNSNFKNITGTLNADGSNPVGWGLYNNGGISTTTRVVSGGLFGTNYFRVTANSATSNTLGMYTNAGSGMWTPGVTYLISFWARAGSANIAGLYMEGLYSNMGFSSATNTANPQLALNTWQRYVWRVQPANNGSTPSGELYISWSVGGGGYGTFPAGGVLEICAPQVEQGELVSAYAPRPDEILPGTITSTEISDGAITTSKIVTGAVTANTIAANAVSADKITANAVSADKITANAITSDKISANAITSDKIAANSITSAKIEAGAITTGLLAADAVTADKIAANAVTASEISAGAVTAGKIAANAVTASEIAAGAITAEKVSAGAITTAALAADAVTADKIAANAVTASEISAGAITTGKIAAGAVTANEIAANAVTAAKIDAGAVTTNKLAANAVTANEIAANAIVAAKIAAGAVETAKLAAGAVTANEIAAGAVIAGKIAANAVTANEIAANAVTANKVAAGAITAGKIDVTSLSAISATIGTLRTAVSGARTEIKDNLIEVYDANRLRVRIGIW